MLVLTRRTGQQITFPDSNITLTVVNVRNNVVKLGIEAPQDARVLRARKRARTEVKGVTIEWTSGRSWPSDLNDPEQEHRSKAQRRFY